MFKVLLFISGRLVNNNNKYYNNYKNKLVWKSDLSQHHKLCANIPYLPEYKMMLNIRWPLSN